MHVQSDGMEGKASDGEQSRWCSSDQRIRIGNLFAGQNGLQPYVRIEKILHLRMPLSRSSMRISLARFAASMPFFSGASRMHPTQSIFAGSPARTPGGVSLIDSA